MSDKYVGDKDMTSDELKRSADRIVCIINRAENNFLVADGTKTFVARGSQYPSQNSWFLLTQEGDSIKFYSLFYRDYVSAFGEGWVLRGFTQDPDWSLFKIENPADRDGWSYIRSANPGAAASPYVSVVGPDRLVRVAEAQPRPIGEWWSDFRILRLSTLTV